MPSRESLGLLALISEGFALTTSSGHLSALEFNRLVRRRLPPRNRFTHDHHDTCTYVERRKNLNVVAYTANLCDARTGEAVESGAGRECVLKSKDPIHAYFVTLEPSYVAARRAKGIVGDFDDLNILERTLAYGYKASPVDPNTIVKELAPLKLAWPSQLQPEEVKAMSSWWGGFLPQVVSFVALPSWSAVLVRLPPLPPGGEGSQEAGGEGSGFFAPEDTVVALIARIGGTLSLLKHVYVGSVEPKRFYQLPSVEYIEVFGISIETGDETYEKKIP